MTIRELHDRLAALLGREEAEPEFRPARAGDVPHSLADITATREVLGYVPRVSPGEGLEAVASHAGEREETGPDVIFRIA